MQIRCLDLSADRTKLALVDEQSRLAVYDIATKVVAEHPLRLSVRAWEGCTRV